MSGLKFDKVVVKDEKNLREVGNWFDIKPGTEIEVKKDQEPLAILYFRKVVVAIFNLAGPKDQ